MIKNLIIGYVKVNQAQEKKQVLKMIGTLLNFSPAEIEQTEHAGESRWLGFLSKSTPSKSPTNKNLDIGGSGEANSLNKSFTELLIQYVDRESKPKPNLAFDLSTSNSAAAGQQRNSQDAAAINKKTDSLGGDIINSSSLLLNSNGSASAVKFFNNSLSANNPDLVNRSSILTSSSSPSLSQQQQNAQNEAINSAANQFLDQILK
jgi:hypothetical protein